MAVAFRPTGRVPASPHLCSPVAQALSLPTRHSCRVLRSSRHHAVPRATYARKAMGESATPDRSPIWHLLAPTASYGLRIIGGNHRPARIRLQPMRPPDPPHAGFAQPGGFGHAARAPVSNTLRPLQHGLVDHFPDLCARDLRVAPRTRSVLFQGGQTLLQESTAPARRLLRLIPSWAAISLSCNPSAARRMMRARSTTRAGSDRARARCCNISSCWPSRTTFRATRIASPASNVEGISALT